MVKLCLRANIVFQLRKIKHNKNRFEAEGAETIDITMKVQVYRIPMYIKILFIFCAFLFSCSTRLLSTVLA